MVDAGADEYKLAKEAFVTGHTGTTMSEMFLINTVFPVSCWLGHVCTSLVERSLNLQLADHPLLDFCFGVLFVAIPLLISATLPQFVAHLLAIEAVLLALIHFLARRPRKDILEQGRAVELSHLSSTRKPFITMYRGGMMLWTCIAILAVDFQIFPRRFAKTEEYGVSLMDAGVGAFMISMGLVSRQVRPRSDSGKKSAQHVKIFKRVLGSVSPMIVLGSIRLAVNSLVNYQHHVSEYGVHWNFFFTLAAVALLVAVVNPPPFYSTVLGVAGVSVYQYALNNGLTDLIMHDPRRDTLVLANKEGICSSIGFCSLYLISMDIGRFLSRGRKSLRRWGITSLWLGLFAATCFGVSVFLHTSVEPISRRLANASYVFWCLAINVFVLAALLAGNVLGALYFPSRIPLVTSKERGSSRKPVDGTLLRAINKNQLALFLVANILTGATNLSIQTLYVETVPAFLILLAYTTLVSGVAAAWQHFGITLKFW